MKTIVFIGGTPSRVLIAAALAAGCVALVAPDMADAQTRGIVPRASGEGRIGTDALPWGTTVVHSVRLSEGGTVKAAIVARTNGVDVFAGSSNVLNVTAEGLRVGSGLITGAKIADWDDGGGVYRADGQTVLLRGSTFSVADYISQNALGTWYRLALHLASDGQDFLGGMSAMYQAEGRGLDTGLSSGFDWTGNGYRRTVTPDSGSCAFSNAADVSLPRTSSQAVSVAGFTALTVALWINSEGNGNNQWACMGQWSAGDGAANFSFYSGGGAYGLRLWYDGLSCVDCYADGAAPVGVWTHLAATWDGSEMLFYTNGASVATNSSGAIALTATDVLTQIGSAGGSYTYRADGLYYDAAIWSSCLTPSQVAALASGASKPSAFTSGLVGYWPCDEGAGTTLQDDAGNADMDFTAMAYGWVSDLVLGASTNMLLLTSNSVFDVSSSNAIVTFVADGLSDPAQASAGIRNATEGTTIWGQNLRILDASTASNTIWIADITNGASFGTNRQVAVFVSSNSAAVVKGCAAAMGE